MVITHYIPKNTKTLQGTGNFFVTQTFRTKPRSTIFKNGLGRSYGNRSLGVVFFRGQWGGPDSSPGAPKHHALRPNPETHRFGSLTLQNHVIIHMDPYGTEGHPGCQWVTYFAGPSRPEPNRLVCGPLPPGGSKRRKDYSFDALPVLRATWRDLRVLSVCTARSTRTGNTERPTEQEWLPHAQGKVVLNERDKKWRTFQ